MSKIEVDAIDKQSGSTLTLGGSGTAVTLASGATQSGFGREGSVDWQTTIKTGDFTAVSGEGYFINTTSGTITMTLPSSPSVGDIVALKDYANTFDTNNLTINRNGQPISGEAVNAIISTEGQALTLVYGDATKGWQSVAASTEPDLPKAKFVTATGGTITTVCTNFKVHTFTGPGTFSISCAGNSLGSNSVDYVVVAGGGSGGNGFVNNNCGPGGGGAGGYRESSGAASGCYSRSPLGACVSALPVTVQGYPITVGAGGTAAGPGPSPGSSQGSNSIFSTIISTGGGKGGNATPAPPAPACVQNGGSGGSGGGGARIIGPTPGGAGNTPPVSPPQGQPGGTGSPGAGGGGATAAGTGGVNCSSVGNGGAGATTSISGSSTAYAGGGGAGHTCGEPGGGTGGTGGGGAGGLHGPTAGCAACTQGTAGTANTGGGGGGQGGALSNPSPATSGAGGSGIVIIRYKFQ